MGYEALIGMAASMLGGIGGGGGGGGGGEAGMPGFQESTTTTTYTFDVNSPFQVGGKGNKAGGQTTGDNPSGSNTDQPGLIHVDKTVLIVGGALVALMMILLVWRK